MSVIRLFIASLLLAVVMFSAQLATTVENAFAHTSAYECWSHSRYYVTYTHYTSPYGNMRHEITSATNLYTYC